MVGNGGPNVWTGNDTVVRGDFNGDKWTFWQKDIRSGQILKFTQSDNDPSKGTLDVIQGDAVSLDQEEKMRHREGQNDLTEVDYRVKHAWLDNGETKRSPVSSSGNLVSMPESMKEQATASTGNARADMALIKIVGDPEAVKRQMTARNHEEAAKMNAHDDAVGSQRQPSYPKP